MVYFRKSPDGSLSTPKRGSPPPTPKGYEPLAGDPFTFKLINIKCKYRELIYPTKKCGCTHTQIKCHYYDYNVVNKQCEKCTIKD